MYGVSYFGMDEGEGARLLAALAGTGLPRARSLPRHWSKG